MTTYLLDTNIWLRTVQRESPHHSLAVEALATLLAQGDEVFITAQNVIERLSEKVTHPAIPPPQPSPDGGGSRLLPPSGGGWEGGGDFSDSF